MNTRAMHSTVPNTAERLRRLETAMLMPASLADRLRAMSRRYIRRPECKALLEEAARLAEAVIALSDRDDFIA